MSTIESIGGSSVLYAEDMIEKVGTVATDSEKEAERERYLANVFLNNADDKRYNGVRERLEESVALGRNEYPRTLSDMHEFMSNKCPDSNVKNNSGNRGNNNSNKFSMLQRGRYLAQTGGNSPINSNWVLLDSCSTNIVFRESKFPSYIQSCSKLEKLQMESGSGVVTYSSKGIIKLQDLPVHYKKGTIANVLSFKEVSSIPGVRITVDTDVDQAMLVHMGSRVLKFTQCNDGLFYLDLTNYKLNESLTDYTTPTNFCLLQSVDKIKSLHTKSQIKRAKNS